MSFIHAGQGEDQNAGTGGLRAGGTAFGAEHPLQTFGRETVWLLLTPWAVGRLLLHKADNSTFVLVVENPFLY